MSVEKNMCGENKKHHFVLVHGPNHGAWCWHKVKPELEALGHRVTAVNLAASGDHPGSIKKIFTCDQYAEPLLELLESLPLGEKVVLLGHSTGGSCVAIAMDMFPKKIVVAAFTAAFMPDTQNSPAFVVDKFASNLPKEAWLDSRFEPYGLEGMSLSLGTEFMRQGLYTLSPPEDLEFALSEKRPGSLFINELAKREKHSEEKYGSVPRAYIVCKNDQAITEEYQRWMIDNYPPHLVVEMDETDHMPMFSNPQLLSTRLLEIAETFA
ncbi:unnamed protein product [Cochlearia groenlandica]